MKKVLFSAVIILVILIFTALACVGTIQGADGSSANGSLININKIQGEATQAANATATYGAEQFFLQMTAIAEEP